MLLEELSETRQVTNICLNKLVVPVSLDLRQIALLDFRRVEIIQLVEQNQVMPQPKKPFRQMRTDEASTAGKENCHGSANDEVRSGNDDVGSALGEPQSTTMTRDPRAQRTSTVQL